MIGDIFKALVWDNLVKVALAQLFLAAPFLAWGPLGWLVGVIVTKLTDILYAAFSMAVSLEAIVLVNAEHKKAFDDASVALQIIGKEKGVGSQEFKDARLTHQAALSTFVRFHT